MFVDGPPTLGSHILRLGGYWAKERPYSKRHAIPKSRWDAYHAEDDMRKETMRFEADTLKTLMQIRPYHRLPSCIFLPFLNFFFFFNSVFPNLLSSLFYFVQVLSTSEWLAWNLIKADGIRPKQTIRNFGLLSHLTSVTAR